MTDASDTPAYPRNGPRPGGRSARVQAAVHTAVRAIQTENGELSIPSIAARAGVTPSTIYRRWGDLDALLADVAVEQLRPDSAPLDTGSYHGDLQAWLEQYAEEMASAPGRAMLRDTLITQAQGSVGRCLLYCTQQLDAIDARASERGEATVPVQRIIDTAVAPLMYRLLFAGETPGTAEIKHWLHDAMLVHPAK